MRAVDDYEILVSLEHSDGTAAIARGPDGEVVLDAFLGRRGPRLLHGCPLVVWLEGERALQGGLLPEGAAGAELVDAAGQQLTASAANGAWLALLERSDRSGANPVRFFDADGQTVASPIPADWPRAPIADAEDSCPACGAVAWEQVTALDDSRGMLGSLAGPEMEPAPFARCRECGHEEESGDWTAYGPSADEEEEPDPEEHERLRRELSLGRRLREGAAIAAVDFPVYVAAGRSAQIVGWGGRNGAVDRMRVGHSDAAQEGERLPLTVETAKVERDHGSESEVAIARSALESLLWEGGPAPRHLSPPARAIWFAAKERARRRLAALATLREVQLAIDGEPQDFQLVDAGRSWAAARRRGDLMITVSSTGPAPDSVDLERADDLRSLVSDGSAG